MNKHYHIITFFCCFILNVSWCYGQDSFGAEVSPYIQKLSTLVIDEIVSENSGLVTLNKEITYSDSAHVLVTAEMPESVSALTFRKKVRDFVNKYEDIKLLKPWFVYSDDKNLTEVVFYTIVE